MAGVSRTRPAVVGWTAGGRIQVMSAPYLYPSIADIDAPVTAHELARFRELQERFARCFGYIFEDPALPRTVLIVPSLSLDQEVMARISGVHHYEERMLCLLLLLRMPRTRVIYVSSTPISDIIIDYYLHLLPGVPGVLRAAVSLYCRATTPPRYR